MENDGIKLLRKNFTSWRGSHKDGHLKWKYLTRKEEGGRGGGEEEKEDSEEEKEEDFNIKL
jgi:hypothetical protein